MNAANSGSAFANAVATVGLNYRGSGVRGAAPEYPHFHASYPDRFIIGTETASTVRSRGVYTFPVVSGCGEPASKGGGLTPEGQVSSYDLYFAAVAGRGATSAFTALAEEGSPDVAGGGFPRDVTNGEFSRDVADGNAAAEGAFADVALSAGYARNPSGAPPRAPRGAVAPRPRDSTVVLASLGGAVAVMKGRGAARSCGQRAVSQQDLRGSCGSSAPRGAAATADAGCSSPRRSGPPSRSFTLTRSLAS